MSLSISRRDNVVSTGILIVYCILIGVFALGEARDCCIEGHLGLYSIDIPCVSFIL